MRTGLIRMLGDSLADLTDFISRAATRKLHLPPKRLRDVGSGDFEGIGAEFLGYFIEFGRLAPADRVLEIGCGCGRMALPLTRYLHGNGCYVGMDVVRESIAWCRKRISARYPNFHFYFADIHSKRYNPRGTRLARDYTFPLEDGSFDVVLLTSVFTHMVPDDVECYLREISRLLNDKGRVFITLFLLNETQHALAKQGRNQIVFLFARGDYRIIDVEMPESAVSYEEAYIRDLFDRHDLSINEPIIYGKWSGRHDGRSLQDIVVASKNIRDQLIKDV